MSVYYTNLHARMLSLHAYSSSIVVLAQEIGVKTCTPAVLRTPFSVMGGAVLIIRMLLSMASTHVGNPETPAKKNPSPIFPLY